MQQWSLEGIAMGIAIGTEELRVEGAFCSRCEEHADKDLSGELEPFKDLFWQTRDVHSNAAL